MSPTREEGASSASGTSPGEVSDAELVQRARTGDAPSFEALVRRYLAVAYAVARPLVESEVDAEDACQDAFIRALERLEDCRDPARFKSWFLTIVRNRAHNVRRYEARRDGAALDAAVQPASGDPLRDTQNREIRDRIDRALADLTELQRRVFVMHHEEGRRHAEIGRALGISEGAARFHLHAARQKLQGSLGEFAPEGTDHEL